MAAPMRARYTSLLSYQVVARSSSSVASLAVQRSDDYDDRGATLTVETPEAAPKFKRPRRYDAFGVFGFALEEKIGV